LLFPALHTPRFVWECKDNDSFWLSKFKAKNFKNSEIPFGDSNEPFSVTGCKDTLGIWNQQKIFSSLYRFPHPFDLGVQKYLGKWAVGNSALILFVAIRFGLPRPREA
jgi:hypothetical protein